MGILKDILNKVRVNKGINREQAIALIDVEIEDLLEAADEIRKQFCGEKFDFCSIINGKSGKCSEDCKYCAQSAHYHTHIQEYPLLDKEVILKDAIHHACAGVKRYSIVTSGKKLNSGDIDEICEIYKMLDNDLKLNLCASHGLLSKEEFIALKKSGVKRYHNNLETSRRFFPSICSTHTYDQKIETIKIAQEVGLEVCSGGIFGIGETIEDRIDMAFELRDLNVNSIPLNVLSPIEGTPLEGQKNITEEEFLRSAAIFRFINPTKVIRLAGGRELLQGYGKRAFKGGINGTITGDLLTTCGNTIAKDYELINEMGFTTD